MRSETYPTWGEESPGSEAPTHQRVKAARRALGRGRGAGTDKGTGGEPREDVVRVPVVQATGEHTLTPVTSPT